MAKQTSKSRSGKGRSASPQRYSSKENRSSRTSSQNHGKGSGRYDDPGHDSHSGSTSSKGTSNYPDRSYDDNYESKESQYGNEGYSEKGGGYSPFDYGDDTEFPDQYEGKDIDPYSEEGESYDRPYEDNYDNEYEESYDKGDSRDDYNKDSLEREEPIHDPPYDGYDEEAPSKQSRSQTDSSYGKGGGEDLPEADMVFTEEEVYGNDDQEADMVFTEEEVYGNDDQEADMVFTEEEVYGNEDADNHEDRPDRPDRRRRGDIFEQFVERYGMIRFRNAQEINRFFSDHSNETDFLTWFSANIGGRNHWSNRRFGTISEENRASFNNVWNRIPLIYRGRNEDYSINVFQFFALVSIMINEVGKTFQPIRERGSLSYMFGTIIPATRRRPQRRKRSYNNYGAGPNRRNNKTAFELFNDEHFLRAHRNKANYERVANTNNRSWHGDVYPSGFPTRPGDGGIISEADFYKFSGRGLVQTTWSRSYLRLIEETMTYDGDNPTIIQFKNHWRQKSEEGMSIRNIASQTTNRQWDELFMRTENEFACLAVHSFQAHRNTFLNIPVDPRILRSDSTRQSGSIFYVGYRVGGSRSYGGLVKSRVIQMMENLLQNSNG